MRIYFDIETGPQSHGAIKNILTYKEEPFKPRGNTKKRETIARQHEEWEADAPIREAEWYSKQIGKAALNPLVGQVVAVGFSTDTSSDTQVVLASQTVTETHLIMCLLREIGHVIDRGGEAVTYNGDSFDWPFLIARCRVLGIKVGDFIKIPPFDRFGKTPECLVDLAKEWMFNGSRYNRSYELPKFEELCRVFGVPAKTQGWRGDQFHQKMITHPEEAADYLKEDVEGLRLLCDKIIGRVWK